MTCAAVAFFALRARAQVLLVNGTTSNGNQLIYDPTLNITWLDYTYTGGGNGTSIFQADSYASNFSVAVNGNNVSGWSMPDLQTIETLNSDLGNPSQSFETAPFHNLQSSTNYWTTSTFGWGEVDQDTGYYNYNLQNGSVGSDLSGSGPDDTLLYHAGNIAGSKSTQSSNLIYNGTDANGDQLLYDPELNITWLDHTYTGPSNNGSNISQADSWASNLNVNINGSNVNGWTIPDITTIETLDQYDLGNTLGSTISSTGPFLTLLPGTPYWTSSTFGWGEVDQDTGYYYFDFLNGSVGGDLAGTGPDEALVYHAGDIIGNNVPEPTGSLILATGLGVLGLKRR